MSPTFILVSPKSVTTEHNFVPLEEATKMEIVGKVDAYNMIPVNKDIKSEEKINLPIAPNVLPPLDETENSRPLDSASHDSQGLTHGGALKESTPSEPQEDSYAHDLHRDERALLLHHSESQSADDRMKKQIADHIHDLSSHPHSHHEHDHDLYDIKRKSEMDLVRDRLMRLPHTSGEESADRDRMRHEESVRRHLDRMLAREIFEGRGQELTGVNDSAKDDVPPQDRKDLHRLGI